MIITTKTDFSKMICEDVMEIEEAAEFLHVSPRTLERYRTEGTGPYYFDMSEKVKLYPRVMIYHWMTTRLRKSTSDDGSQVDKILESLEQLIEQSLQSNLMPEIKKAPGRPRTLPPAGNLPQQANGQELAQQSTIQNNPQF